MTRLLAVLWEDRGREPNDVFTLVRAALAGGAEVISESTATPDDTAATDSRSASSLSLALSVFREGEASEALGVECLAELTVACLDDMGVTFPVLPLDRGGPVSGVGVGDAVARRDGLCNRLLL